MNKFIIFLCFIIVFSLHILFLKNYKKEQILVSKPQNNTLFLLQLSKVKEIQENTKIAETAPFVEKLQTPQISEVLKKIEKKNPKIVKDKIVKKTFQEKKKKEVLKEEIKTFEQNSTKEIKDIKKPIIDSVSSLNSEENKQIIDQNSKDLEKKIQQYINSYATKLREEINKNKKYPIISKKLKEEGNVIISFRVLNSGLFTNIKVNHSSNKIRLDKAALNALYDTKQYEVFNKELSNKEFLDFELALEFKLY